MVKNKPKKEFSACVLGASDLAAYQRNAVVSREIIKNACGTVTAFAFDKGQGLSEHTAPFNALVLVLDGEATIFVCKKKHAVRKGQMILMPANKPHALRADKKFKMLLVMVRG